jgi:hypothetical protein
LEGEGDLLSLVALKSTFPPISVFFLILVLLISKHYVNKTRIRIPFQNRDEDRPLKVAVREWPIDLPRLVERDDHSLWKRPIGARCKVGLGVPEDPRLGHENSSDGQTTAAF